MSRAILSPYGLIKRVNPSASRYRVKAILRQISAIDSDHEKNNRMHEKHREEACKRREPTWEPAPPTWHTRRQKAPEQALISVRGLMSSFAASVLGRGYKRWVPKLRRGERKGKTAAEIRALIEERRQEVMPKRWEKILGISLIWYEGSATDPNGIKHYSWPGKGAWIKHIKEKS